MKQTPTRKALTEKQVMERYGISVSKLQKDRMNRRGIPYVKIGKSCRYLVEDLDAYFSRHRIIPNGSHMLEKDSTGTAK